jgi:hypothetical protein
MAQAPLLMKTDKHIFENSYSHWDSQGCGAGKFEDGSGSDILSDYSSGSGSYTCIYKYIYE